MTIPSNTIAYSLGEPAGIGSDIILQYAADSDVSNIVCIGDSRALQDRAEKLNLTMALNNLTVINVPVDSPLVCGKPAPENAKGILAMLDRAISGCLTGEFAAMVTGPLHKAVINDAGIPFSGHTEYLAEKTDADRSVMLLASGDLRVALLTTHLPLRAVSDAVTRERILQICSIIDNDLKRKFGIAEPTIMVCGLNPHAGEGGHLGREEIETIEPTLDELRARGLNIIGPVPADTAFTPASLASADVVLAMYHDQGLPVLKALSFGEAANITLGLPIIRTSVDHGTALDIAGTGKADIGGLKSAISVARLMVKNTTAKTLQTKMRKNLDTQFNAPRKTLGQNFLQDPNIIRKIVNALGVREGDTVLEIGPGRGALTELLLETGCTLHLVEFDRDLIEYWQDQTPTHPQLKVHGSDILDFDFAELNLQPNQTIKIVGNLPYNISSPILILLLEYAHIIDRLVIMLQKEVIDRLSAEHGNKQYGRLTVMVQQAFSVGNLFTVPNTAFYPPPKVTSAVAELLPHENLPINNRTLFSEMVKQAFGQRRKTLRNNFKNWEHWAQLQELDIDFTRRAETVSVAEYVQWCNAIDPT